MDFRNAMLAVMIPSRRGGMGGAADLNPQEIGVSSNIEIQEAFFNGGWPHGDSYAGDLGKYWDHGHAQTIALPYTVKLYKYLLNDGGLK